MRNTRKFSFRHLPLPAAICLMFASAPVALAADVAGNELTTTLGAGVVRYVGDSTRLSVGYDTNLKLTGEFLQLLYENDTHAILGEGWFGALSAGGLKLSYNILNDKENPQVVYKAFGALDQNAEHDRKATIGLGFEKQSVFGGLNFSKGLTGRRLVSSDTSTSSLVSGPTTVTTTVERDVYEKAYDYGAGARVGTLFNDIQLRVTGGLDYEWGLENTNARQVSASLKLEKFFSNKPHSLSLQITGSRKDGHFEENRDSQSVQLLYRYSFGQSYRPEHLTRKVSYEATGDTPRIEPIVAPQNKQVVQKKIVKHTVSVASDAFFALDKYALTASAKQELERIAERIKGSGITGNIRVIGNTCDLGSDKHNLALSRNRAEAVRTYLLDQGVGTAESLLAEGLGESQPKYPNTNAGRYKNRRVDIEFVTYEDATEDVAAPASASETRTAAKDEPSVKWRDEEVPQEPAWIRRALRSPQEHKRAVDVYRIVEQRSTSSSVVNNSPPVAVDDAFTVDRNSDVNALYVVANDTDPGGDAVGIDNAWGAEQGTIEIDGSNVIYYTPALDFSGTETFTYRIHDNHGNISNIATVTVTVR